MADSTPGSLPDSEALEALAAFADGCNFTRAARALGRSQPAVHAQVKRLGEQLGAVLYRRAGRGLELTDEGLRAAAFARDVLARAALLRSSLAGATAPERVALCAGEGAYLYLLGPGLERFARGAAARGATLELLTRDAGQTVEAVRSGLAQLGVAVRTSKDFPRELEVVPLARCGQIAVLARAHPLARRRSLRVRDLAALPLVLPPPGRPHRDAIDAVFRSQGLAPTVAAEAQGWALLLHFAALGLGCAVVNGCCRVPPRHVGVPVRDLPETEYVLLSRRAAGPSKTVAALREALLRGAAG